MAKWLMAGFDPFLPLAVHWLWSGKSLGFVPLGNPTGVPSQV
jgi:hypothetical protein